MWETGSSSLPTVDLQQDPAMEVVVSSASGAHTYTKPSSDQPGLWARLSVTLLGEKDQAEKGRWWWVSEWRAAPGAAQGGWEDACERHPRPSLPPGRGEAIGAVSLTTFSILMSKHRPCRELAWDTWSLGGLSFAFCFTKNCLTWENLSLDIRET